MQEQLDGIKKFADSLDGAVDNVVLLGMGGSSLAPEVLRRLFDVRRLPRPRHDAPEGDPRARGFARPRADGVRRVLEVGDDARDALAPRLLLGEDRRQAPRAFRRGHRPELRPRAPARERGFAAVFSGEPTIGGRYSALSPFGIVPAVLMGIDAGELLERAQAMREACRSGERESRLRARRAARRGLARRPRQGLHRRLRHGLRALGRAADRGVDGQAGQGPHPRARRVAGRARIARAPTPSSPTRTRSAPSSSAGSSPSPWPARISRSTRSTSPTSRRRRTRRTRCSRPARSRSWRTTARSRSCLRRRKRATTSACRRSFSRRRRTTSASPISSPTSAARSGLVVTHGYGPRYLHSTGQLHKGGPNTGLFLQVVDDPGEELAIPGKEFGFRRFIRSQAEGDYESLKARDRRVARIHWED